MLFKMETQADKVAFIVCIILIICIILILSLISIIVNVFNILQVPLRREQSSRKCQFKNIVHLVDDMFWNMGVKTEKQSELVRSIIHIISKLFIKHIMPIKYTCMCEIVGVRGF